MPVRPRTTQASRAAASATASVAATSNNSNAPGRKSLLLAAVCASLSSTETSAFAVGRHFVGRPAPVRISSLLSSPTNGIDDGSDDDVYFFTAPTPASTASSDAIDTTAVEKTRKTPETEANDEANENDDDFLDSITFSEASPGSESSETPSPPADALPAAPERPVASAVSMDVDGNGTGALMNRSHAAGGVDAPLMVTSYKPRDFPIDSGKEGMQAGDTRARTSRRETDGEPVDPTRPGVRLVRYGDSLAAKLRPREEPTPPAATKRLVLASSLATNNAKDNANAKLAKTRGVPPEGSRRKLHLKARPKPLVRYNGPDLENTTDHDGMETDAVREERDRAIRLGRANLVRYRGASQLEKLETPARDPSEGTGPPEAGGTPPRKTLSDDVAYANRYTGLTDFTLAKKTGLAVNKPISLWVERDKFL